MQKDVFPATLAQQRLWLLHQLAPESPADNIAIALRLIGLLHITALEQSLNEVIRRHDALRTTFSVVEGQLMQLIAPVFPLQHAPGKLVALQVVALQKLPEDQREPEAQRLVNV